MCRLGRVWSVLSAHLEVDEFITSPSWLSSEGHAGGPGARCQPPSTQTRMDSSLSGAGVLCPHSGPRGVHLTQVLPGPRGARLTQTLPSTPRRAECAGDPDPSATCRDEETETQRVRLSKIHSYGQNPPTSFLLRGSFPALVPSLKANLNCWGSTRRWTSEKMILSTRT